MVMSATMLVMLFNFNTNGGRFGDDGGDVEIYDQDASDDEDELEGDLRAFGASKLASKLASNLASNLTSSTWKAADTGVE